MVQQNKGTKEQRNKGTKKQNVHPIGSGITRSPGLVSIPIGYSDAKWCIQNGLIMSSDEPINVVH